MEKDTHTHKERHRETERQTDRQTDRQRQRDRESEREVERAYNVMFKGKGNRIISIRVKASSPVQTIENMS